MKSTLCFCILFCAVLSLSAQQQPSITIKVVNFKDKLIRVQKPLDGKYLVGFPLDDSLNANGELVLPNREKVAGEYIFYYKKAYRLYVQPGRQYKVIIDDSNQQTPVSVEGPDKEAQVALASLTFDHYQSTGQRYSRQDTVFAHNKQRILKELDSCLLPFRKLHAQHKMEAGFYGYTECLIRSYYATVLGVTLYNATMKLECSKDSVRYDPARINVVQGYWKEVLAIANVQDARAIATDTYADYSDVITRWYYNYLLRRMQGDLAMWKNDSERLMSIYKSVNQYYTKEPLREYLVGILLRTATLENRFESGIPDIYEAFARRYPRSAFIPVLKPEVAVVQAFLVKQNSQFTSEQRFVEQFESIETIDQLASRFKDKVVFLDMWATWCGPCKEQFQYNEELKAFLTKKGIDMLYLSIDNNEADKQWKTMIRYYNLRGYHVRASDKLNKDIRKVFGVDGSIMIPRYALLKNGKVVLSEAKAPGDKNDLYRQLEQYL